MSEYVRVKSKATGHESTVTDRNYQLHADAYTLLDKPAVDVAGDPLPDKHKTTVAKQAAVKRTPAPRKRAAKKQASTTTRAATSATSEKE